MDDEVVKSFMFFMRSYLRGEGDLTYGTDLTKDQVEIVFNVSHECILLYETYGFENSELQVLIEDSISVLKDLINLQFISFNKAPINYGKIIDMVMINQCPIEIKRNVLYLLDTIIFMDQEGALTDDLVRMYDMLDKIWTADE